VFVFEHVLVYIFACDRVSHSVSLIIRFGVSLSVSVALALVCVFVLVLGLVLVLTLGLLVIVCNTNIFSLIFTKFGYLTNHLSSGF